MKTYRRVALAMLAGMLPVAVGAAPPQTWVADPRHSSAQFTVTHFGISHVRGIIPISSAVIEGPSPQLPVKIEASLDAGGVDTRNGTRDNDLKSPHFFDASQYPALKFSSASIVPVDAKGFMVTGNLTIHGVTRPVTLKVAFLGEATDDRGEPRVAYEATTAIKRSDFGMTYLPVVVGDDVDIDIDIEAVGH